MSGATVAIVGGSGVTAGALLDEPTSREVTTPFGTVTVSLGRLAGRPVTFLARHGPGHRVPPHRIAYRANVAALDRVGVTRVLATSAVGALDPQLGPGSVVLVDQFLDHTKGRPATFFDGGDDGVVHVDVTAPYCPQLRATVADAAGDVQLRDGGTYVCTEGPRFETAAEIRAFRMLGGDVVGMTGVPEVVLARELGLCYATVATVTNVAAGLRDAPLSHREVLAAQSANADRLRGLLARALAALPDERSCGCAATPEPIAGGEPDGAT